MQKQIQEWYQLLPPPVLDGLLNHGGHEHQDQRPHRRRPSEWRDGGEAEQGDGEKVDVGHPPELLEEGLWQEGDRTVLGGGDVVGLVVVAFTGGSVDGAGAACAVSEGVELAQEQPPLPVLASPVGVREGH